MRNIVWGRSINFNLELSNLRKYTRYTIIKELYSWRKTFVWRPRCSITGKRLFLCNAYRRRVVVCWGGCFHCEPYVEYATMLDIIGDTR
jgi:hypothetical protein